MDTPKFKLGEVVIYKNPNSLYYRQYTIFSAELEVDTTRPGWRYTLSDRKLFMIEESALVKIKS